VLTAPAGNGAGNGRRASDASTAESRPQRGEAPPAAADRVEAPHGSFRVPLLQVPGSGSGAVGRRSRAETTTGRPVGDRPLDGGADLAVLPTLRRAAPHQRARGRAAAGLALRAEDLRAAVREGREGNLVLFVVDASGSMAARRRMSAVKGAVLALLRDSYQRRDRVGLIAFRAGGAEVVLAPTSSVEVAAARLTDLATGGRTPLAAGLARAREVVLAERLRDPRRRALVVLVTDGRANAPVHDPLGAARSEAARLIAEGARLVVLDTEDGPARLGLARELAAACAAPALALDDLGGLVHEIRGRAA
jgi:magnesium chelatase subunit D